MEISKIVTWIILGVCCVFDLAYKRIPRVFIIAGVALGGALLWKEGVIWFELIISLLPGMVLLSMSFLTEEKIGYGDGLLVIALGMLEGGATCLWDLGIGLLGAVVVVTALLILKKVDKETEIPFVPFLLAAHTLGCLIGV